LAANSGGGGEKTVIPNGYSATSSR